MNPTINFRQTKPTLHLFYLKTAFTHLLAIDAMLENLRGFGNINMLGFIQAIETEREKLVAENAAYTDADELIRLLPKKS